MPLSNKLLAAVAAAISLGAIPTLAHPQGVLHGSNWPTAVIAGAQRAQAATASVDAAFSPDANALDLVLRVIGTAQRSIRLSAYSFTSAAVTKALLDAKRRGVDVQVVVDEKNNVSEDRSGKAAAALGALVAAGIPVRTISTYPIHHDKFIVVDERAVETGSFNYSDAAARRNSENVLVLWDRPDIAAKYLTHWQSRFKAGVPYRPRYG